MMVFLFLVAGCVSDIVLAAGKQFLSVKNDTEYEMRIEVQYFDRKLKGMEFSLAYSQAERDEIYRKKQAGEFIVDDFFILQPQEVREIGFLSDKKEDASIKDAQAIVKTTWTYNPYTLSLKNPFVLVSNKKGNACTLTIGFIGQLLSSRLHVKSILCDVKAR